MAATLSLLSPPPPPMAAATTFPSFTTTLSLHPPRIPFFSLSHSHLLFKPISFPSLVSSSFFTPRATFNPQHSNQDEYEDDDDDEDTDYEDEDEDEKDEYKEGDDDDDDDDYDDKEDYYKDVEDKRRVGVELVEEDFKIDLWGPETETEEEIAMAYEKLYGPGFSGKSYFGNDVYEMDAEVRDELDDWGIEEEGQQVNDGFEEKVIQVRRVTKVVKGGKIMRFRAVVIVGNRKGMVGVGHGKAGEVVDAVKKAGIDGRRHLVKAPLTKYNTFPHRMEARYGAAKVMIRPARPGSGLQAGAVLRTIIDMCGVQNALGKQLGSDNALNNARAAIIAIGRMRSFREVAQDRGIPMEELWK